MSPSTITRTLAALDKAVREVIVLAANLPDEAMDNLTLSWDYHTGDDTVDQQTAHIRHLRTEADQLSAQASAHTATMARQLIERGSRYGMRQHCSGSALSAQRVSQITGHERASQHHIADHLTHPGHTLDRLHTRRVVTVPSRYYLS